MSYYNEQALSHHGIKGMKWGRRRFQNADGSLTPAGKSRYADDDNGGLGDTTKRAANRQQMKARNQDQARNLAKYAVERANARKSIKNPAKRAVQMVKDSYNMPCLSMTGKYSKYGKEVAKGALIGWAASVAVVGLLDHYT